MRQERKRRETVQKPAARKNGWKMGGEEIHLRNRSSKKRPGKRLGKRQAKRTVDAADIVDVSACFLNPRDLHWVIGLVVL